MSIVYNITSSELRTSIFKYIILSLDRFSNTILLPIFVYYKITTSLLRLNVIFIFFNKFGEHSAPAHITNSSVVITCPWSRSCLAANNKSIYIVGVPYKTVHLLTIHDILLESTFFVLHLLKNYRTRYIELD